MKRSKKLIISLVSALAAIAVPATCLGIHFCYNGNLDFVQSNETVNTNGQPLKVAIISDLQLPDSKDKTTHQYDSFEKTLTMLKGRNPDALLIAGDFTDLATKDAWNIYKEIYDRVLGDDAPILMTIMGNHDYWLPYFVDCGEVGTPTSLQKRYTSYTGQPVYANHEINGYHFICWSSSNGTYDTSYKNLDQVRTEIENAIAEDPTKPVFVITHLNPSDTSYGSDDWGNDDINELLKNYPQVVSISAHSHYSLIDERAIWQDTYTAFTTQSLDYIELEPGKFNGSIPKDAYGNNIAENIPGCMFMSVEDGKITVERLEANTGKALKDPWVIEAPFTSPDKYTTESRKAANTAPALDENLTVQISQITDIDGKPRSAISFKAGTDDDFVHSYRLRFLDENKAPISFAQTDYSGNVMHYNDDGDKISVDSKDYENGKEKQIDFLLYFSDFVLGLDNMAENALLRLPDNMPENTKYVEITAIDSWGAESNSVVCAIGG